MTLQGSFKLLVDSVRVGSHWNTHRDNLSTACLYLSFSTKVSIGMSLSLSKLHGVTTTLARRCHASRAAVLSLSNLATTNTRSSTNSSRMHQVASSSRWVNTDSNITVREWVSEWVIDNDTAEIIRIMPCHVSTLAGSDETRSRKNMSDDPVLSFLRKRFQLTISYFLPFITHTISYMFVSIITVLWRPGHRRARWFLWIRRSPYHRCHHHTALLG